jgi:protein SCO1/2
MIRGARLLPLVLAFSCSRPDPLGVFNTVPDFVLPAHTGAEFDSASQLRGRVWIADFIFTTCKGPCPRMSALMQRVQTRLSDRPDIRFVSFTVDPETDTPDVLAEYARRYQAAPDRWFFLTGKREALHKLCREAFLLSNVDGSLDHSTRFVLVDRRGRIRKYFASSEPEMVSDLAEAARRLASETS